MAKNEGVSAGMVVFATVVGGVFGAVAGLLLAPQAGKKTQEKLMETYEKAEENVNNVVKKVDEKVSGVLSKIASEVKDLPEQVKTEVSRMAKEAEVTFTETVEKGSSYFDGLKGSVTTTVQEGKKKILDKKELAASGK